MTSIIDAVWSLRTAMRRLWVVGAICTPHAFAFDRDRRLRYRGRIDDSRTGRRVTSDDLERAVTDMLDGRPPSVAETAPFGCAIVW